jgi:hypothetical protein
MVLANRQRRPNEFLQLHLLLPFYGQLDTSTFLTEVRELSSGVAHARWVRRTEEQLRPDSRTIPRRAMAMLLAQQRAMRKCSQPLDVLSCHYSID